MTSELVVVGLPDERFSLLAAACARAGREAPKLISYAEALTGLQKHVGEGTVVRLESTDEEPTARTLYLVRGAEIHDRFEPHAERISAADAPHQEFFPGEIRTMRQLHLGRSAVWEQIHEQANSLGARLMNSAAGLTISFDKRTTAQRMRANNVPTPTSPGAARCFDDIATIITEVPGQQLMIKTAHGAGATGIVALRANNNRWQALSAALLTGSALWNTRTVRSLNSVSEIRALVDAVCRQVVHVEHWVPKAATTEGRFDLRVVVIGGTARHVLMRCADGPFTNLHLGAKRGDVGALRRRLGEEMWDQILRIAERAVEAIGGLLYAGVDILLQSNWKTILVLEVNGFGDWHPDVLVDGNDTYDWELRELSESVDPSTNDATT
jgi:glutathione synthase/RimK-type ligase-like ATP-grasp enzyme